MASAASLFPFHCLQWLPLAIFGGASHELTVFPCAVAADLTCERSGCIQGSHKLVRLGYGFFDAVWSKTISLHNINGALVIYLKCSARVYDYKKKLVDRLM